MKKTLVGIIKNVRNIPSSYMTLQKHIAQGTIESPIIIYSDIVIKIKSPGGFHKVLLLLLVL